MSGVEISPVAYGRNTTLVEAACAALVLTGVIILLCAIVTRFRLHVPIIWIDELAPTLFVFLGAMLKIAGVIHRMIGFLNVLLNRVGDKLNYVPLAGIAVITLTLGILTNL